ncbi:uncharacterized protein N7473_008535 [Penicillium subrubescens]|uniref:uncharacterized protein n=1 Tax=Penicillium subrubescens TaxID=1316194 RepID=UPI002545290E|nr:uncharacterized protein N7473_008535 [Penicillium subrubescens]KAJ5892307.1 hypothetical protein N7473_008535 [Penicillium subrubescens]
MSESDDPPESPSRICGRRRQLLLSIIKQNDLSQLHQDDTFLVAATHGSPEILRVLLDVYAAAPEVVERFDRRQLYLLHDACSAANLDIVHLFLDSHNSQDSQLPLETVNLHARDEIGKTPILEAAASLIDLHRDADEAEENEGADWIEWVRDRIARGEQLIHFLLDRGCSATDDIPPAADFGPFLNDTAVDNGQPRGGVLGLAVSRASGRLVQRLIDLGADVHLKHHQFHDVVSLHFLNREFYKHNITTLDTASLFWNFEAVKLLLDHLNHRSKVQISTGPDLVSFPDSTGRFPLHLAAHGPGISECRLPDEEISFRITETFRLLLEHSPTSINLPDDAGSIPLHYVARTHTTCGGSQHAELAIRTLLEYGADTTITDDSGRTVLHIVGYSSLGCDPVGTGLLELLVAHGININHADQRGNTALHVMAENLCHISTARFLLDNGADIRATNAKGETPFHAGARGKLFDRTHRDGTFEKLTIEDRIRAHEETMRILEEAVGRDNATMMMSQPNLEGKTPQKLLEETRDRWRELKQRMRGGGGRGRGRGRGPPPRE